MDDTDLYDEATRSTGDVAPQQPGADRRSGGRLRAVHRVARIFAGSTGGLARVLTVSDDALVLATQLELSLGCVLSVDLSDSCSLEGQVVWHGAGRCGLRLLEPIDSGALLKRLDAEQQPGHSLRLPMPLEKAVVVESDLGIQILRIRDVSRSGIKVVHDGRFRPGMAVKVRIAPGIERRGIVCWSQDGIAGCILTECIGVGELGSMTDLR